MNWKILRFWEWGKKKRSVKTFNIYHEEFADKVEPVTDHEGNQLEVDGIKYYRFKQDTMMPYGRYKYLEMFIKQVDLKMTPKILLGFLDKIQQNISGEKGHIDLNKVHQACESIRARVILTFEIETVYSYASVVYFDDTENLFEYDKKLNDAKIARWREANTIDFFYMRPLDELLGLRTISREDLENYIKIIREITNPTLETTEP